MKKSNIITLVVLILAVILVAAFSLKGKTDEPSSETQSNASVSIHETSKKDETTSVAETKKETTTQKETSAAVKDGVSMPNTLFIGDSRTVGLMEYSKIKEANFFCNVGMSVFNIYTERISVPGISKTTLEELLNSTQYDKIYIMLGINELGYNFDSIIKQYGALLDYIREKQPDALIIIQANLHVTKKRSDSDKVINNAAIDKLNKKLSEFANSKDIIYLDANILFDDENGNLSAEKTEDSAHIYAKYYAQWAEWIDKKTAEYIKE